MSYPIKVTLHASEVSEALSILSPDHPGNLPRLNLDFVKHGSLPADG